MTSAWGLAKRAESSYTRKGYLTGIQPLKLCLVVVRTGLRVQDRP